MSSVPAQTRWRVRRWPTRSCAGEPQGCRRPAGTPPASAPLDPGVAAVSPSPRRTSTACACYLRSQSCKGALRRPLWSSTTRSYARPTSCSGVAPVPQTLLLWRPRLGCFPMMCSMMRGRGLRRCARRLRRAGSARARPLSDVLRRSTRRCAPSSMRSARWRTPPRRLRPPQQQHATPLGQTPMPPSAPVTSQRRTPTARASRPSMRSRRAWRHSRSSSRP
mmetsp:Transcript_8625/g.35155  ORF Transcript_8625/g.35155 Transcript_8625/m.35155 type:complete len:221 (-) Transcript_8625:2044-2706(-)